MNFEKSLWLAEIMRPASLAKVIFAGQQAVQFRTTFHSWPYASNRQLSMTLAQFHIYNKETRSASFKLLIKSTKSPVFNQALIIYETWYNIAICGSSLYLHASTSLTRHNSYQFTQRYTWKWRNNYQSYKIQINPVRCNTTWDTNLNLPKTSAIAIVSRDTASNMQCHVIEGRNNIISRSWDTVCHSSWSLQ